MNLREQIQKERVAAAVPLEPVETPEWPSVDGQLFVGALSPFEVDQLFNAGEEDGNHRARFAARVMRDQNGQRPLTDDDAVWLGQKENAVVERFYWRGRRLNGLTEANREAVRKNSDAAAGDGSPSSSAAPSPPVLASTSTP